MDIYFIRHGDSDYEHDSLTEMGHFQAEKTSEELVKIPFDMIFSSSMNRAIETAKHLTNKTNQKIISFDWAREDRTWLHMHDTDENGKDRWFFDVKKNQKLLSKLIGKKEWYKSFKPSFEQLLKEDGGEIDKWLLSLNILHRDGKYEIIGKTPEKVAFFAHGGFGLVFYSYILDLDYPSVLSIYGQQELCGVAHFKITDNGVELICHNKTYY
jgi:probable phosphoglycerate mutase